MQDCILNIFSHEGNTLYYLVMKATPVLFSHEGNTLYYVLLDRSLSADKVGKSIPF